MRFQSADKRTIRVIGSGSSTDGPCNDGRESVDSNPSGQAGTQWGCGAPRPDWDPYLAAERDLSLMEKCRSRDDCVRVELHRSGGIRIGRTRAGRR